MNVTFRNKRSTVMAYCHAGVDYELDLSRRPSESVVAGYIKPIIEMASANVLVVGYATDDPHCENPLESCDGEGRVYSSHRHAKAEEYREMQKAMGLDTDWGPDYEHSAVVERSDALLRARIEQSTAAKAAFMQAAMEAGVEDEINPDHLFKLVSDSFFARTQSVESEHADRLARALEQEYMLDWRALLREAWSDCIALGTIGDKDAVKLDCYEHGGQHWSVSGTGMQCRFDTARGAGIWVPDDCAREEIRRREKVYAFGQVDKGTRNMPWTATYEGLAGKEQSDACAEWYDAFQWLESRIASDSRIPGKEQTASGQEHAARELARGSLSLYNDWLAGYCYNAVAVAFELKDGKATEIADEIWHGYVGQDAIVDAMQELVAAEVSLIQSNAA